MQSMSARRQRGWILVAGSIATLVGALVAVLIAIGTGPKVDWSGPYRLILFMLASIAIASLIGFIFGVPRARAALVQTEDDLEDPKGPKGPTTVRFEANSNLEQISDWLTKILVGAGLVQLAALPGFLESLGNYLGASLGTAGPQSAVAIVLYGFGVGFLFAYLWARLRLRVLLESSETEAHAESRRDLLVRKLSSASANASDADDPVEIDRAAARADLLPHNVGGIGALLWVDDHPENNRELIDAMRELGVDVNLALTTADALSVLEHRRFGLIITDLGRTEHGDDRPMAGLELIHAVAERPGHPPIFVYAGRRGLENESQLREAGAAFVTTSPSALFDRAVTVLATSR